MIRPAAQVANVAVLAILFVLSSEWLVHVIGVFSTAIREDVRLRKGLCPACGYDLHGTPGSICSECGRAIESTIAP